MSEEKRYEVVPGTTVEIRAEAKAQSPPLIIAALDGAPMKAVPLTNPFDKKFLFVAKKKTGSSYICDLAIHFPEPQAGGMVFVSIYSVTPDGGRQGEDKFKISASIPDLPMRLEFVVVSQRSGGEVKGLRPPRPWPSRK